MKVLTIRSFVSRWSSRCKLQACRHRRRPRRNCRELPATTDLPSRKRRRTDYPFIDGDTATTHLRTGVDSRRLGAQGERARATSRACVLVRRIGRRDSGDSTTRRLRTAAGGALRRGTWASQWRLKMDRLLSLFHTFKAGTVNRRNGQRGVNYYNGRGSASLGQRGVSSC